MATENTSLKDTTPAGDSNTSTEMVIGKINTYQCTFLIVAGSLLALLVLIAVAGTSGGQHLDSSTNEIAEGTVALADFQADSANLVLTKDIFGQKPAPENNKPDCNHKLGLDVNCNRCHFCRDCCGQNWCLNGICRCEFRPTGNYCVCTGPKCY